MARASDHGSGVRRLLGLSAVACIAAVAVAAAPAAAAAPAPTTVVAAESPGSGTSSLAGRLAVPGPGAAPADVTVTLRGDPTSGDSITRTTTTRADGTFAFTGLAGGDWVYTVTAPYQGTTFSTDLLRVAAGQRLSFTLPLYASTTSPDKVRATSWMVWLDVTGDRLAVQQDLALTNSGTAAYTGTVPVKGATEGAKAAVLLAVAPSAGTFEYLGRFEVCCSAVQDGTWAHTRPVDPGSSTGTLRYETPSLATLPLRAPFATDKLTVLVPEGTTVSSPRLTSDGTANDRGITYRVYVASSLAAGETLTLAVTLPTSAEGTPWGTVTAAALAVVVIGVVVWMLLRRRSRRATAQREDTVAAAAAVRPTRPESPSARPSAPKPRRAASDVPRGQASGSSRPAAGSEALTEELARLDLAFEDGSLTDAAAYLRVRETLVARLVAAVEREESSTARR